MHTIEDFRDSVLFYLQNLIKLNHLRQTTNLIYSASLVVNITKIGLRRVTLEAKQ